MTSLLTSSLPAVRYGAQQPRVLNVPQGIVRTLGGEVADFMEMVGKPLLPWQRQVCDVAFALRSDGKWAAYEVAVWLARQNGKGVITEAQELFGAYMLRERKIIHSAHLFDTSREAFLRLVEIIEGSDWLRARTRKPIVARGSEAIPLTREAGGGEIKFKARTQHGARGFSGDRIVLDEAYALTVSQFKAMSPTLATIPNVQITYTSSPPDEKTGPMPEDAMAPSIRKRGLLGTDPRLASFEWSPNEGADPTDVDEWYRNNPSLGYLIDEEFLENQCRIFVAAGKREGFATEHLGAWPVEGGPQWQVVSERHWTNATDATSAMQDPVAFAVYLTPDREWGCIAAAGAREDADLCVEIVAQEPRSDWIPARVVELVRKWQPCMLVIDSAGAGANLTVEVRKALDEAAETDPTVEIDITEMNTTDVRKAYGMFVDALTRPEAADREGVDGVPWRLWHRGDARLTAAAKGAMTRTVGREGTTWDTLEMTVDGSPLVAATNAVWAYVTRPWQMVPMVAHR